MIVVTSDNGTHKLTSLRVIKVETVSERLAAIDRDATMPQSDCQVQTHAGDT